MDFNCTYCGLCCTKIGQAVNQAKQSVDAGELVDALTFETAHFPYRYDEAGRCEMLTNENFCSVYSHRPDICNIGRMHEKYFSHLMGKRKFFEVNEEICKELQESEKKLT